LYLNTKNKKFYFVKQFALFSPLNLKPMAATFLGLRTCIYRIPNHDLVAAKEWYANALGIKPYFSEPFYVGFEVGGYELGLSPIPDSPDFPALPAVALAEEGPSVTLDEALPAPTDAKPASAEATAGKGDNVETYWGVEDIQTAFAQLLSAGATSHEQPNNVGGDIWVAILKDPWGNMIGIIQNPHFEAK
jgi:lactoylglutathione lyase